MDPNTLTGNFPASQLPLLNQPNSAFSYPNSLPAASTASLYQPTLSSRVVPNTSIINNAALRTAPTSDISFTKPVLINRREKASKNQNTAFISREASSN
jgi:hypothetical protein